MIKPGLFLENLKISINAIRANALRTILTILIIAFGIMALIGILTAVESIKHTISSEFQRLGANTFNIRSDSFYSSRNVVPKRISYRDAISFKNNYDFPASVGIYTYASGTAKVRYKDNITEPNIAVVGVNEDYLITSGNEINAGRNFISSEVISGDRLVIIGSEIYKTLFSKDEDPIDQFITIGTRRYRVIGVLKERGTSLAGGEDRACLLPLNEVRQNYRINNDYIINVMPRDPLMLDFAISEAEGVFRNVRRLTVFQENNFRITKSDSLVKMMIDNLTVITLGASIIGIITLIGASIGLMNIMLVSVAERTREIGTRKAIGATSKAIKQQFLFEAVFIGQLGGILGIILGVLAGNLVSVFTNGVFVVPYFWVLLGLVLCFFVGIASGYIPAIKASKLPPIEALRYE